MVENIKKGLWNFFKPTVGKVISLFILLFTQIFTMINYKYCGIDFSPCKDYLFKDIFLLKWIQGFLWLLYRITDAIIYVIFNEILHINLSENVIKYLSYTVLTIIFYVCICFFVSLQRFYKLLKKDFKKETFILIFVIIFITLCSSGLALSDSISNNNNMNVSVNVIETINLELNFVPVKLGNYSTNNFQSNIADHAEFLRNIYPLADDAVTYTTSSPVTYSTTDLDVAIFRFIFSLPIAKVQSDKYIGIFNKPPGPDKEIGIAAMRLSSKSVLAHEDFFITTAHEVGHTYFLCDEYDISLWEEQDTFITPCPNAKNGSSFNQECVNTSLPDSENHGCLVENKPLIDDLFFDSTSTHLINIMGGEANNSNITHWIDKETYNNLLNKLSTENYFVSESVALVYGYATKSGNIFLKNFYVVDGGYLTNESEYTSGNYSVLIKDNQSNNLYEFNFTPYFGSSPFGENSTESNESYFIFVVPYENVSSFEFYVNGTLNGTRNVSDNTPSITLTYPLGNEKFEEPFNITWNASDADNDTLYYAVLISSDNGTNYITLDFDLNQTYYEIDPNNYDYGEAYVIKVLATDSVNTNESVVGNLTIGFLNETEERNAILQGINNSLGNVSVYYDYYIKRMNSTANQTEKFDVVTEYQNQTWAFNYISYVESFTNMANLPASSSNPVLVIWENESLNSTEITYQVESLINSTKV